MARNSDANRDIDKTIGRRIKELRIAKGLSLMDLVDFVGVTHQQLYKYENGSNRVAPSRLLALARAFGVSVMHFFQDIESHVPIQSNHERMALELSRVFLAMKDVKQQVALLALARTLN